MDSRLLEILCCPITRRPLACLDATTLSLINKAISDSKVRNHGGAPLDKPLTDALVTPEGDLVYPVRDDVPVLLEKECIHWAAFRD